MSTPNLKIEYENGNLVTLEKDGVSLLPLNVTAIHFSHTMKTKPHLKVEIESGGGPYATSPEPAAEPVNTTDTPPTNEGKYYHVQQTKVSVYAVHESVTATTILPGANNV